MTLASMSRPFHCFFLSWFVIWNMFYFPSIGNVIIPTDYSHIFQSGRLSTTNQCHIWSEFKLFWTCSLWLYMCHFFVMLGGALLRHVGTNHQSESRVVRICCLFHLYGPVRSLQWKWKPPAVFASWRSKSGLIWAMFSLIHYYPKWI